MLGVLLLVLVAAVRTDEATAPTAPQAPNTRMALQLLESLFGANSTSSCAGAVDMQTVRHMQRPPVSNRLGILPRPDPGVNRYINFGAGTTGTRFVFGIMCDMFHVSGTHYASHCFLHKHNMKGTRVSSWYHSLQAHMSSDPPTKSAVEERDLVAMLQDMLIEHKGGSFWTDTPVANVFADVVGALPWALSMATYRAPRDWAQRRLDEHGRDVICRPRLWGAPGVLHPFDMAGCLNASRTVEEAFVSIKDVSSDLLEMAYIKMNTVNARLALDSDLHFLPLCLFDNESSSAESVAALLRRSGMRAGPKPAPQGGGETAVRSP